MNFITLNVDEGFRDPEMAVKYLKSRSSFSSAYHMCSLFRFRFGILNYRNLLSCFCSHSEVLDQTW
jgi:hypothetical protein